MTAERAFARTPDSRPADMAQRRVVPCSQAVAVLADHRLDAVAQRARQEAIDHSPQALKQESTRHEVENGLLMLAQRMRHAALFGEASSPAPVSGGARVSGPQTRATREPSHASMPAQMKAPDRAAAARQAPSHSHETGLPDPLKAGVESLSGLSMDAVRVHYNSAQPAQLSASAYAQGHDIHVAPGQERHLPHEAWHLVQQAQGRVRPTTQRADGVAVNDDAALEREADLMGARAAGVAAQTATQAARPDPVSSPEAVAQPMPVWTTLGVAQLRTLKLGDRKLANHGLARKNKDFMKAIAAFKEQHADIDAAHIDDLISQLFSAEGETMDGMEQFLIELAYDVESKSEKDAPLTLQERYLTEYGWKRARDKPTSALPVPDPDARLKLFRTMSIDHWKELSRGNYAVLQGGHIGDFKQSLKYFLGESTDTKVLVEFTLKKGAERALFSNQVGLPKASDRSEKLKTIAKVVGGDTFPVVSKDQGYSDSGIGLKSESEGEAGFSIAIGGGTSPDRFKSLVEGISIRQIGKDFVKVSNADAKGVKGEAYSAIEADASRLLEVNNCLINAIANAALGRNATLGELVAIRSVLANHGEMLVASPEVVGLIRQSLHIDNHVTIVYSDDRPSEDFDGPGAALLIYHVDGNHFTHEAPEL